MSSKYFSSRKDPKQTQDNTRVTVGQSTNSSSDVLIDDRPPQESNPCKDC